MGRTRRVIFLVCRASELWAYTNGQVHAEHFLTRKCISLFHEGVQVAFQNRAMAAAVRGTFSASK